MTDHPDGEHVDIDPEVWASRLAEEIRAAHDMDIESHTTLRDTDDREHTVELGGDVEKVETSGRNVVVWLRNAGIVTLTGGAVVAAIALIRHRRRQH